MKSHGGRDAAYILVSQIGTFLPGRMFSLRAG
jgi:hypothetical protein